VVDGFIAGTGVGDENGEELSDPGEAGERSDEDDSNEARFSGKAILAHSLGLDPEGIVTENQQSG